MKKISLILLGFLVFSCSCKQPEEKIVSSGPVVRTVKTQWVPDSITNKNKFTQKFSVITVESCEYLIGLDPNEGRIFSHKGDCRYCIQRNEVLIESTILKIQENITSNSLNY